MSMQAEKSPAPDGTERAPAAAAGELGAAAPWAAMSQSSELGGAAGPMGSQSEELAGRSPDPRVRRQVEAVTGADLGGVQVFTGGPSAKAAEQLGASAFATGSEIHFGAGQYAPGSPGGDHLLAHELAHTAQKRPADGAAQLKSTRVSQASDPAEREADRVADAAVSGAGARITPVETAAPVARSTEHLSGNPAELTDNTGAARTTHRAPTLQDGVNQPTAAAAGQQEDVLNVRVVADATSPIRSEPPSTPQASALYERSAEMVNPAPAGFTTITGFDGTLSAPQLQQEANNDVFINGQPTATDVQQSGIGSCYFLATLMSMAERDPGRILNMITPDGNGGATIKLWSWRATEHEPSTWEQIFGGAPERDWTQVDVAVNDQLAFNLANGRVHGAQLRCADNPMAAEHWAALNGERMSIHAKETFQCARWAPLLEKAYARFSETHDQYGGARSGGASGGSGYAAIDGGWSHKAMCVLYGPEADTAEAALQQQTTTWAPGGDVVASNHATMELLVQLQGRGASASPGDTDAPIITATSMVNPLIDRLIAALPVAQADPDYANVEADRQALVTQVGTAATAWQALPFDPAPPAPQPKTTARNGVATACVNALMPGYNESTAHRSIMERFGRFTQRPIPYGNNETAVPAGWNPVLDSFNENLAFFKNPHVRVDVAGHASRTGPSEENQRISQERADGVQALVGGPRAIAPHTTQVTAHGDTGATPDPAWRKVELSVTPTGHEQNSLLSDARSPAIRAAVELMLNLRNAGTDSSTGQRNIYGDHVYSVVAVNLVTATDHEVPLSTIPAVFRPLLYPLVNPDRSTIQLRNPHHNNEPDRHANNQPTHAGDGAPTTTPGSESDGLFTMTLNEFFRSFTSVESGVFPRG